MLRFDPNLRWLFTEVPMWERYAAAARAGFRGVEVAFPYEYPASTLNAMLRDEGLALVQILAPVDWEGGSRGDAALPDRKDACRASIETAIDYAVGVGGPMVHVLAGNLDAHHDRAECMATFHENIAYAADLAAPEGLTIIIEPVSNARFPAYLYSRLDEGMAIIDALGRPNVKLCFDTYHVQMQEGALTDRLRQVFPYVGHVQIGNTPGRNEPGVGELDLGYFFRTLEALGWDRWVGCEYAPSTSTLESIGWHEPFRTPDMKILSYLRDGRPSWGAVEGDDRIVDLGHIAPTLRAALAGPGIDDLGARVAAADRAASLRLDEVRLLPVVPDPQKIVCIGLNYEAHRLEAKRAETKYPTLFPRWPTSQTAHGADIPLPPESVQLDFEGEIALVIGRGGRRIAEADAWSHIAGYAPYNDASIRDWQYHTTQWGAGKNFDGTGAFGPWMVTRDEVEDGQRLKLVTRLNGDEVQRGNTDQLIFSIPVLIHYISTVMTLAPGDVIVTGTPAGVGVKREPPLFMKAGDRIEVEVVGIGRLENRIVAEAVGG